MHHLPDISEEFPLHLLQTPDFLLLPALLQSGRLPVQVVLMKTFPQLYLTFLIQFA